MTPGATGVELPSTATLPASFGQESMWFLHGCEPGSCTYNVVAAFNLRGALDTGALEKSFIDLVHRHEALRTTFIVENGELLQVIHDDARCPFSALEAREEDADRMGSDFARHAFNLEHGPLLRVAVLRLRPDLHRLLLNVHHIAFDGWSLGVLLEELALIYRARLGGDEAAPKPLPVQYGDFAVWQRAWMAGAAGAEQLAFWKRHLGELPPALELPTDPTPAAAAEISDGAEHLFEIPQNLAAHLPAFCAREKITLFMLLSGAFQALLHRYTGQTCFLIGTPLANRTREEVAGLIGLFVNTVVLRADLAAEPSGRELLRRVREEALAAFEHGELPFEKLVEELNPDRSAGRNPLFRTMFALQNQRTHPGAFAGLEMRTHPVQVGAAKLDLLLEMVEEGGDLRGSVSYRTGLFESATIARLMRHFTSLLRGIVGTPDVPIGALELLDSAERATLLTWSSNKRPWPQPRIVHALFAEQSDSAPERIAVIDGATRTTYGELREQAAQITHRLNAAGVRRGDFVGLPAERSTRFVAALLGILRAGAAYVPLDSKETAARAQTIRASCRLVLDLNESVPSIDADLHPVQLGPEDAACVLHTSGSTGEPKGVVIPHRGIVRLVRGSDYVVFAEDEVIAFASNLCFDAATFEIWGALLNGGCLVVTPVDIILDAQRFAAHLNEHGVTTLFLTTSLFNQLARETPAMFRTLRNVVFGGEAADSASVARVLAAGPPQRLVNGYGPTEATTFAVCHVVKKVDGARIPIGKPIANSTAFVLDPQLQLVPIGVAGELYIGGPGLALGYHNDPGLTDAKFLQTPWGKLYRTGDRARWLLDGTIDFLGRIDGQIKLRGFRIEPGAIEAALGGIPGIGGSAVVARAVRDTEKELVAYYTSNGVEPPSATTIREQLASMLPAWMVPNALVRLDRFPLTANGKLDVAALPPPIAERAGFSGPTNTLHAQLIDLWEELLGRRPIGVQDDFFALGGHSLLAARMLGEIDSRIGRRLPFSALFSNPTIAHLSDLLVADERRASGDSPVVALHEGGARTPFFFLHGDFSGGGFYCRGMARGIGVDRPFYVLHPHGLHGEAPPPTIAQMATERLETVRRIQPHGPYLLGGFCNGAFVAFEMTRQLEASGERVAALVLFAADSDNLRFRHVHRLTDALGRILGESPEVRSTRFLVWRKKLLNVEQWGRGQRMRITQAVRHPEQLAGKAARLWKRAALPEFTTERRDPFENAPTSVLKAYVRALETYVPESISAPLVLVCPEEDLEGDPVQPWRVVAPQVRAIVVPGEHHSSIARAANLGIVAERMRDVLDDADAGARAGLSSEGT